MSNPENYILVRSLSRLRTDDVVSYFRGIVGEDIIKENTISVNPNEIILNFRNAHAAEKVLEKTVHQIKFENGMILLLQVDKSFDRSLILSNTSQQSDHDKQQEANSRNPERIFWKSSAENMSRQYGNQFNKSDVKPKTYQAESEQEKWRKVELVDTPKKRNPRRKSKPNQNAFFHSNDAINELYMEKPSIIGNRGPSSEASFSSRSSQSPSITENSDFGQDDNTCIEVTGISPKTDSSTLRLFFENCRRSGGGDIKIFTRKETDTVAYVTFYKKSVANSVLDRRELILDDCKLMARKASIEDHSVINAPYDNAKFLISRIPTETSLRSVYDFVENITERKSGYKLIKGTLPGLRLVFFEKVIDYFNILERCKMSKLKGRMFISKVRRTSKIEVYGFPEEISKDMLLLYFESTKNGGGDVSLIDIDEEYKVAIITFKDFKTVQEVTKLKHTIKDKQLKVCPYYDCIGYQLPAEKMSDCICEIEVDPKIFNFIKNHKSSLEEFKKLIEENSCEQDLSCTDQSKIVLKKLQSSTMSTSNWKRSTNDKIIDFFNKFKCSCKENNHYLNVIKKLYEMVSDSQDRTISIDDNLRTVEIIGLKNAVDRTELEIREISQKQMKKVISLPAYKIRLLTKNINELKSDCVNVTCDQKKEQIVLNGGTVFVLAASEELEKHISSIVSLESCLLSSYKLLKTKSVHQFVIDSFKKASIFVSFEFLQNGKILLGSTKMESNIQALNIIKKSIKQINIPLKKEFSGDNLEGNLQKFIKNISETHTGCVDIILEKDSISIAAVCGLIENVKKEIEEFLEKNYTSDSMYDLIQHDSLGNFFANSYQNEIVDLEKQFHTNIQVSGFSKIFLKGSSQNVILVTDAIIKYIDTIISDNYVIDKPEINIWFKDEYLEDCVTAVQKKHSCWIKEVKEPISQQKVSPKGGISSILPSPVPSVVRSNISGIQLQGSSSLSFTAKVQVKLGDITKEKVDAVVNGVYQNSIKTGAISKAIITAAGTVVEGEYSSAGQIYPGFTITGGGNLPCSHIIHMQLNFGSNFINDIVNCFKLAEKEGYRSIALPAFGTGNAGHKANDMASQIFDAVEQYNKLLMSKTLMQILIVIYDTNLLQVFSDELNQRNSLSSTQSNAIFSVNGLTVELKTGDIFSENVDIIVNSIDSSLNLLQARGAVAQRLKEKGGSQIVDECQTLGRTNADGLASTTAGNLPFKKIIHFATNDATNLWQQRVANCLTLADSFSASSIAMPVFGTGAGGLSTSEAANILLAGLLMFSGATILKTVKIIIFDSSMLAEFITIFQASINPAKNSTSTMMFNTKQNLIMPQYPPKKFVIHVKDQPTLIKVKSEITLWLDKRVMTQEFSISSIILEKIQEIQDISKKDGVITVINNNKLIVKGLNENVAKAIFKLHQIITSANEASALANKVQWYFRLTVNSNYQPVSTSQNYLLENAYKNKSRDSFSINSTSCNIHSNLLKRTDLVNDKTPLEWDSMTGNEAVIILDTNSAEYGNVSSHFIKSLGHHPTIVKISRIQNKSLYDQYRAQKEMMDNKNGSGFKNERILYHGTDSSCLASINCTGFNRSLAGQNGTAYGNGSYFALNASYSHSYAKPDPGSSEKNMYHCKVLAGKITRGASGMKVVPPNFDSLVDGSSSPSIFVIFHDAAAYPEYLITYK